MIAMLGGKVVDHDAHKIVIDCTGVGYEVAVCLDEQGAMPIGSTVSLFVSENIKEDAHDLFGFTTKTRRELFRQLISVSGVGPKAAMAIVSLASEGLIRKAIASGDTAFISRASGVGKKVAERVVVDLKNKMGLIASSDATDFLYDGGVSDADEAVQALVALGYSLADAKSAVAHIDPSLPLSQRVAEALRTGK